VKSPRSSRLAQSHGGIFARPRGRGAVAIAIGLAVATLAAGCSKTEATRVVAAGAPTSTVRIAAQEGQAGERFGGALWYDTFADPIAPDYYATPGQAAMSSDGRIVVVGAPGAALDEQLGAGAVYVFVRTGDSWRQRATLTSDDAAAYDGFGWTVALSGDGRTLIAGAPFVDIDGAENRGAAYVFRENGGDWTQTATLLADNSAAYDEFGWAVAIARGDRYVAIGATGHTVGDADRSGAAYIFTIDAARGAWLQKAVLTPPEPLPRSSFGAAVDVSADGEIAAVTDATHQDENGELLAGSLTVFGSTDGWRTSDRLSHRVESNRNADGEVDAYGVDITISDDGTVIAVAAPDINVGEAFGAGGVVLYSTSCRWARDECDTSSIITSRRPSAHQYFASAVALDAAGTRLFLGNDGAGPEGQGEGEVIELRRADDGSVEPRRRTTFPAPNPNEGRFGTAVALSASGSTAVATAPFLTIKGRPEQGGAFVLELAPPKTSR
jgi:hypothetical protein